MDGQDSDRYDAFRLYERWTGWDCLWRGVHVSLVLRRLRPGLRQGEEG